MERPGDSRYQFGLDCYTTGVCLQRAEYLRGHEGQARFRAALCYLPWQRRQDYGEYLHPGIQPPDLTQLTKTNGGLFPAEKVYQSIDGRAGAPSHARFDMPFWGANFQPEGKQFTADGEEEAKTQILDIVSYIKNIQKK